MESGQTDNTIKGILGVFLISANDWPVHLATLDAFVEHVEDFINGAASKPNIEKKLAGIDLKKDAWYAESIAGILGVYEYYDEAFTLRDILFDLKMKLKEIKRDA